MPNEILSGAFWNLQLGLGLGLLAVLLLRRPLRQLAGARVTYAAWCLPLLLASAAVAPKAPGTVLAFERVEWQAQLTSLPAATGTGWMPALPALWLLGVLAVLGLHLFSHLRFMRGLPSDSEGHLRGPRGSSPGLVGLWRPRLVLPMDFEERFSAQERQWVLEHESVHARRHDNAVRLLAALIQALAWFNPLVWWALAALRHDQELACDATLLPRIGGQWRAYAEALLKAEAPHSFPATAAAWRAAHPIQERITMLKRPIATRVQSNAAKVLLLGSALLAVGLVQAVTPTAKAAKPSTEKLTAAKACPGMPRPELQDMPGATGEFKMMAKARIDAAGKAEVFHFEGDPRFAETIRSTVARYECQRQYAGFEFHQEFVFRLE